MESALTSEEYARQCAEQVWLTDCRYGVVTATVRRPGKNRSATGANHDGWRAEDRPSVLARLDRVVAEIVRGLMLDDLSPEEARERAADAGFAGAIYISESVDELSTHLTNILESGDNVWTDCSPDGGKVVYLRWWSDPSHPRL